VNVETRIRPVDETARQAALTAWDRKAKPRGSLGELESLAAHVAAIRRSANPGPLEAAIVLAAGDHGYAAEGVSAYPATVTRQMVASFAAGRAAITTIAKRAGAHLVVVDAGIAEAFDHPAVRAVRLGAGTANGAAGPAMLREVAVRGLTAGTELAEELAGQGFGIVALGDMGIGNTTTASALCAALLPADADAVCGRGTGIDELTLLRKVAVVRRALAANRPEPDDPTGTLAALGGFELAFLAGVCLGAAATATVILLDGFVTASAALVAARIEPGVRDYFVASHLSPEPGHALVLADLGLQPLLDLGLRLGEGSGAALALPILQSALALLADMATFEQAGVDDRGA
jgi:nicotinate-nucleotide--dimethylbenzimidazole phosphoribosyltransferase